MDYKNIIIRTPIWKTNSIGVNVSGMREDDHIKISISHQKSNGNLYHPFSYVIQVSDIRKYPIGYVKGNNPLYDIPIDELWLISKKTKKIKLNQS